MIQALPQDRCFDHDINKGCGQCDVCKARKAREYEIKTKTIHSSFNGRPIC